MIENIVIENYKSIRRLELTLNRINVLIGANGVGKSNFISFFELMKAIYDQRLGSYTIERGIDNLLHNGIKTSDHIYGFIDFNNTNAFFFNIKPTESRKGYIENTGDYFNGISDITKNYFSWHRVLWDVAKEESGLLYNQEPRARRIKKYLTSFTVYHFHDTSSTSPMRRSCEINDNEYLRANGSNLAAYLYLLEKTDPKVFKLIEGVVRSIAPYFDRFNLRPDLHNPNIITLEWKEKDSDMYFSGYSFSDGTIRFIALATLLLQSNAPEIIIIDEPELGLHPTAINVLAALVRRASKKSQIILSTQSTNLVNCFDIEDIIVVDREDGQSVFKHLNKDDLSVWLDDYSISDLWEKNLIGGQL